MSRRGKKILPDGARPEEKAACGAADTRKGGNAGLCSLGREAPPSVRPFGPRDWLFAAGLLIAVFLVYQPAWQGGLLWDDESHVTRPELHTWHGLYRIWFDVRATLQYYPLVHSAFWLQHKLWGDATLGYHLVNIFLHAVAALMVARILRRLAIPGAYLAAAIFALHPVQVESVAWITELKNTLSAVFYLGAATCYLRFDRGTRYSGSRKAAWYLAALGLFGLALASKTMTGTLPGALLVIFWWQRGRLSWKTDVLPLAPFFLLGAGMGMTTAWWELEVNKCVGPEFEFTPLARILIAGRAAWFHLGTLFWPANLTFIYPRWPINSSMWWQYLFPVGGAALLAATWLIRPRTRGPLAALLFFGGTLFPTLGFFNLYTFRYSLIADHYQYLACLGIITLFSAGVALLLTRAEGWGRVFGRMGCVALVALLAVLSWRQCHMYADIETLYQTTIDRNPDCHMAYNNLGLILAGRGQIDEAITHYRTALTINPDYWEAHFNLGLALLQKGNVEETINQYRLGLEGCPGDAAAHEMLARLLADRGEIDESLAHYRRALEIKPEADGYYKLGVAFAARGKFDEAAAHYRTALEINPDYADAHNNLAALLASRGDADAAIVHYRKALEIKPDNPEAHNNLGLALAGRGEVEDAMVHFRKALEISPDYAEAHNNLGAALASRGQPDEALVQYRKALDLASVRNNRVLADRIRARIGLLQPDASGKPP